MALAVAWLIAVVCVSIAYWIAGDIWKRRHSLKYRIGGNEKRVSGAVGEIILITFGAILVECMDLASPSADIETVYFRSPLVWNGLPAVMLGVAAFVLPFIWIHGVRTALAAEPGERAPLVATYLVYGLYSSIFFFGGATMMVLMIVQFMSDAGPVSQHEAATLQLLAGPFSDADALHRALEYSHLDAQRLLSTVQSAMMPTFVFAIGIFAINMAIRLTPLRSLFINNAVTLTHLMTILGIALILGVGAFTYIGFYSSFIDRYVAALDALRPTMTAMGGGFIERYASIYTEMSAQRSIVGFITRMNSEWSALAVVLAVMQWALQQFQRREAAPSPVDAPPQGSLTA